MWRYAQRGVGSEVLDFRLPWRTRGVFPTSPPAPYVAAGGSPVTRIRILEYTWTKLGLMGVAYICVNIDLFPVLQFDLSPRVRTPRGLSDERYSSVVVPSPGRPRLEVQDHA